MRALVVKELPGIKLHSVIEVEVNNGLLTSKDLKSCIKLEDLILEGVRWQVVKAANEGKEIEYWNTLLGKWVKRSGDDMGFYYNDFYRIAPEPSQPQYVPFTADDWEMFVGKVVKDNKLGRCSLVTSWDEADVFVGEEWFSYESAFKNCTFLDGSPFGKKIS